MNSLKLCSASNQPVGEFIGLPIGESACFKLACGETGTCKQMRVSLPSAMLVKISFRLGYYRRIDQYKTFLLV